MVVHLYFHPASQPSRAVYMTIRALGIEHECHVIDLLSGEHKKPEFLKINPQGKVPAIVDGDLRLSESRAIQTYLCNKYANGLKKNLYPEDPAEKSKVDQMLYISENFEKVVMQEYPGIPKIIFRREPIDEEKRHLLIKALDDVEGHLTEKNFYAGENLTIADFALYVQVRNIDQIPGGFDFTPWPKLAKWISYIQNLPYHDVTNSQGLEFLKTLIHAGLKPKPVEFYHNHLSPFSRAVHMTLLALGIPFEIHEIDLFNGEQKSEAYLKINPQGKVPAIKVGDFCMSESRVIATFLVSHYADDDHKHLYPEDPKQRAKVDMLLYLGLSAFQAMNKWMDIFSYFFRDTMPGEDSSGFDKALADIEAHVQGKFLTGDKVTVADFCLYAPVIWCDVATNYDLSKYPKLQTVFKNIKALPYHDEVNKRAFDFITDKIKEKIAKLKTATPVITGF